MKSSLLLLPLLGLGTLAGVLVDPMDTQGQPPAKAKKEKLEGDWVLVSNESRGFIAETFGQVDDPKTVKIVTFSGKRMTLKVDGHSTRTGRFRLGQGKAPTTLDLTIDIGNGKKVPLEGIYALEGDHLKMCFDSFGEGRPAKFPVRIKDSEKPLGRLSVLALRRVGADPKRDALDQNKAKGARNLATLAGIMQEYVLETRQYPPAAIYSKGGKPLLSWRVALLSRMDEGDLLKQFKTDEPWDSPHNKKLIKKMPKLYALPGVETKEPGRTYFQVFTGKGTVFEGKERLKWADQLNRGSQFMIVEAGKSVPWTKPADLAYDPRKPLPKLGRLTEEGFLAGLTPPGDKVQYIPKSTTEKELRSMILGRAAGEEKNRKEK